MHRLLKVDVQGTKNRSIDLQAKGRGTRNELGVEVGVGTTGLTLAHQLFRQLIQLGEGVSAVTEVVELEIEPPLRRKTGNGRGLGGGR